MTDTWHSYECSPGCIGGSGVVADVRLPVDAPTPRTVLCPLCDEPMRLRGSQPATEGGYLIRDGWNEDRAAAAFAAEMQQYEAAGFPQGEAARAAFIQALRRVQATYEGEFGTGAILGQFSPFPGVTCYTISTEGISCITLPIPAPQ